MHVSQVKHDSKLKFKRHINTTASKIASSVGMMNRLKPFMDSRTLKNIYYALVHSRLNYGITSWGGAAKSNLRRINSLQNRAIRLIYPETENEQNNILPFEKLYDYCSLVELYKCLKTDHSEFFFNQIIQLLPNHNLDTRQNRNQNFTTPFHRCCRTQQSYLFHSIKKWNKLPEYLRNVQSVPSFKTKLKSHIIGNP